MNHNKVLSKQGSTFLGTRQSGNNLLVFGKFLPSFILLAYSLPERAPLKLPSTSQVHITAPKIGLFSFLV